MTANVLYRDLAYVFLAAVLGGLVARKLRQPLILGYVIAGVLVGPFTPGPTVSNVHALELLAEIGVILLMYSIGIEFSPKELLQVKWIALGGGPLGIILSVGLGVATGALLGWSTPQGIAVGAVVSVASTMVLSRFLMDSGQLQTPHGRAMIGITLVEDFAVVILTVLLPSLTALTGDRFVALGISMGKAVLIIAPVILLAAKLVPPLMARVAKTGSEELFVLVAVALGFATAAATQAVGLSLALGAFLAGMVVSGSECAHKTLSHLLPLRDVFVALFFVTIGALIGPMVVWAHAGLLAVLLALIAVGLTQIGEFSYVLVQVARQARLVDNTIYNATLMASVISILINAAAVRIATRRLAPQSSNARVDAAP